MWTLTLTLTSGVDVDRLSIQQFMFTKPVGVPLKWYSCGPTVYSHTHLGHMRSYISFDIIRRILEYSSYPVHMNMNITDIDDKIINKAIDTNTPWRDIALEFEDDFFSSFNAFNVIPPTTITRVSDYIPEMMDFIDRISANGYSYESNGSIYFDYNAYSEKYSYGESLDVKPVTGDGGSKSTDKKDPKDFVLWKAISYNDVENKAPYWKYKDYLGRPGWHIECSAMSFAIFGESIDIHSGGIDLKFPHHCNEIAQTQAALNLDPSNPWCSHWLHSGHLHIQGLKMSKSLKNFITVPEYLSEYGYTPNLFRMFCLLHKFDSNIEWSPDRMKDASSRLNQLTKQLNSIGNLINVNQSNTVDNNPSSDTLDTSIKLSKESSLQLLSKLTDFQISIMEALRNENFNTPKSLNQIDSLLAWVMTLPQVHENMYLLYSTHSWVSHILHSVFGFHPIADPTGISALQNYQLSLGESIDTLSPTSSSHTPQNVLQLQLEELLKKLKKQGFSPTLTSKSTNTKSTQEFSIDRQNLSQSCAILRSQVRRFALTSEPKILPLLETIDTFRDLVLIPQGYQVKDGKDFDCDIVKAFQ